MWLPLVLFGGPPGVHGPQFENQCFKQSAGLVTFCPLSFPCSSDVLQKGQDLLKCISSFVSLWLRAVRCTRVPLQLARSGRVMEWWSGFCTETDTHEFQVAVWRPELWHFDVTAATVVLLEFLIQATSIHIGYKYVNIPAAVFQQHFLKPRFWGLFTNATFGALNVQQVGWVKKSILHFIIFNTI